MFHSEAELKAIGKAFGTPLKLGLSKQKSDSIILAEVGSGCPQALMCRSLGYAQAPGVSWQCCGHDPMLLPIVPAMSGTWLPFPWQNPPAIAWFAVQLQPGSQTLPAWAWAGPGPQVSGCPLSTTICTAAIFLKVSQKLSSNIWMCRLHNMIYRCTYLHTLHQVTQKKPYKKNQIYFSKIISAQNFSTQTENKEHLSQHCAGLQLHLHIDILIPTPLWKPAALLPVRSATGQIYWLWFSSWRVPLPQTQLQPDPTANVLAAQASASHAYSPVGHLHINFQNSFG